MVLTSILFIGICILLILMVILQQGAQGMGLMSGGSDTILGSNEGNLLTKATSFFAVLFIIGSLILAVLSVKPSSLSTDNTVMDPNATTIPQGVAEEKKDNGEKTEE